MQAITQLLDWNEHCLFIFESNVHKKNEIKKQNTTLVIPDPSPIIQHPQHKSLRIVPSANILRLRFRA